MEVITLVIIFIVVLILSVFAIYYFTQLRFERRFRKWQDAAILRWQEEREQAVQQGIAQSRAVLGGKFTEQMAPFLPGFKYDPTEARLIGSPIDLIVFPGLASGDPKEIVIIEIKTGKSSQLSPAERKIRQLIEDGMVRWELLENPAQEAA